MTTAVDPQDEFLHEHPGTALWTESFMFQGYSPATDVGVFFHLGRASWGDPNIWLERVTVSLPNDVVATSIVYRKGHHGRGGGTEAAFAECVEPFQRWRIGFDCAAQSTTLTEMLRGRLRMGSSSPLRLELDWTSTGPLWDQRHMNIDSLKSVHYEQGGELIGTIEFNGQRLAFQGPGRRDRSWGARNTRSLKRHTILHGEFPQAGIYFSTAQFQLNGQTSSTLRGYVATGSRIEDVSSGQMPTVAFFSPRGTPFEARLKTPAREFHIQGKVLHSGAQSLLPPNDMCCGVDLNDENTHMFWPAQVGLTLDGAQGYGFMERSVRPIEAIAEEYRRVRDNESISAPI